MNITDTRAAIAAALSTLPGLDIRPRPIRNPKAGDGWVVLGQTKPAEGFSACDCVFTAVILLGADEIRADEQAEALSVPLVNTVTLGDLHASDVVVEPAQIAVGDSQTPMFALTVVLTLEVDS